MKFVGHGMGSFPFQEKGEQQKCGADQTSRAEWEHGLVKSTSQTRFQFSSHQRYYSFQEGMRLLDCKISRIINSQQCPAWWRDSDLCVKSKLQQELILLLRKSLFWWVVLRWSRVFYKQPQPLRQILCRPML